MKQTERLLGVIGAHLLVRGTLHGKGDLLVEGRFEGEIALDGAISIAASGAVVAPVNAERVEVDGEVIGPVKARELSVRSQGLVRGDVQVERLAIEDGGGIDGALEMSFDEVGFEDTRPGEDAES